MTYPADYLAWLESLESRFNITAGHIWEAGQKYERERIRARVFAAANKTWQAGEAYIGPPHWTLAQFVDRLLEDGDATTE